MNWENEAGQMLKAEIVRRGFTYKRVAERLAAMGIKESERNIANKLSRGTFSFVFVLRCMKAIGAESMRFDFEVDAQADSR